MMSRQPSSSSGGSEAQAKEHCLRLLTSRSYTSAELGAKLKARGYEASVAANAINRLTEVGLVDDHAYAQRFVRSRSEHRGRRVIALELKRKGVAEADAEEAVAQVSDRDEREVAAELVRKITRRDGVPDDDAGRIKVKRRALGMLARRGFDVGLAMDVVRSEIG